MRVVFTDDTTENELFVALTGELIIPRVDEKVFINDTLYEVAQVIHWFQLEEPDRYIEIMLFKS